MCQTLNYQLWGMLLLWSCLPFMLLPARNSGRFQNGRLWEEFCFIQSQMGLVTLPSTLQVSMWEPHLRREKIYSFLADVILLKMYFQLNVWNVKLCVPVRFYLTPEQIGKKSLRNLPLSWNVPHISKYWVSRSKISKITSSKMLQVNSRLKGLPY